VVLKRIQQCILPNQYGKTNIESNWPSRIFVAIPWFIIESLSFHVRVSAHTHTFETEPRGLAKLISP
jgi:hypothetical protein